MSKRFVIGILILAANVNFAQASVDSLQLFNLQEKVNEEQARINNTNEAVSNDFQQKVDLIQYDLFSNGMPLVHKAKYLQSLLTFLESTDRPQSEEYFRSGRYDDIIDFFPGIIYYNKNDQLQQYVNSNPLQALKAFSLFSNTKEAKPFLLEAAKQEPNEILRNVSEFSKKPYRVQVTAEAAKQAPISAKRYLASGNNVRTFLNSSNDTVVKSIFVIYQKHDYKGKSFLLLDNISKGSLDYTTAKETANNKETLFPHLAELALVDKPLAEYSINRELDYLCTDYVRKQEYRTGKFSAEQLYIILLYSVNDLSPETFEALLSKINHKQSSSFNEEMIDNVTPSILQNFLQTAEAMGKTERFKGLFTQNTQAKIDEQLTTEDEQLSFNAAQYFKKVSIAMNSDKSANIVVEEPVITEPIEPKDNVIIKDTQIPVDIEPDYITIELSREEQFLFALSKDVPLSLKDMSTYIDEPYAQTFLMQAAKTHPNDVFKRTSGFKRKFYAKSVLEEAAKNAPIYFKRYIPSTSHTVNLILSRSSDPVVQKLFEVPKEVGNVSRAYILIEDIYNNRLTIQEAHTIANDRNKLFKQMLQIATRENHLGGFTIASELRNESLPFIRSINNLENSSNEVQYKSVEGFTSKELYALMVYGEEEVFKSTFNGLYSRMIGRMHNKDGYAFLEKVGFLKFRVFIKMCANHGKLRDFLNTMPLDKRTALLNKFSSNLEEHYLNIPEVINVADALGSINNQKILESLHKNVKAEYERVYESDNKAGIAIYGLLTRLAKDNAQYDRTWFQQTSARFKLPDLDRVTYNQLDEAQTKKAAQVFFYNDDDGISSYNNFIAHFTKATYWKIEDNSSYVRIYSTSGNKLNILANKPAYEVNGQKEIVTQLEEQNTEPIMVVHRGHSFHTEKTLKRIPESTQILVVGSCGGYYKLPIAIKRAPKAHIIASKQIGTMNVNDPLVLALVEEIRLGNDIVWSDFWSRMERKLGNNALFYDYVPPHKNMGVLFVQAYYQILGV